MPTENKKLISCWLDNDLVDRIDRHKIDRRFPTRVYLIDSVLRTRHFPYGSLNRGTLASNGISM